MRLSGYASVNSSSAHPPETTWGIFMLLDPGSGALFYPGGYDICFVPCGIIICVDGNVYKPTFLTF